MAPCVEGCGAASAGRDTGGDTDSAGAGRSAGDTDVTCAVASVFTGVSASPRGLEAGSGVAGLAGGVRVLATGHLAMPPTRERRLARDPTQSRPPTLRRMAMLPLVPLHRAPAQHLLLHRLPTPGSPD